MTTFYADTSAREQSRQAVGLADDMVYVSRQAVALGIVAGLRSMLPFALLARVPAAVDDQAALERFLHAPGWQQATLIAAACELVADKLPFAGSRLNTGSLLARLTIGAAVGVLLYRRMRQPVMTGVALGAAGAFLGSIVGYSGRTLLPPLSGLPDFVWALLEDGAALGLGWLVMNKNRAVNARRPE